MAWFFGKSKLESKHSDRLELLISALEADIKSLRAAHHESKKSIAALESEVFWLKMKTVQPRSAPTSTASSLRKELTERNNVRPNTDSYNRPAATTLDDLSSSNAQLWATLSRDDLSSSDSYSSSCSSSSYSSSSSDSSSCSD